MTIQTPALRAAAFALGASFLVTGCGKNLGLPDGSTSPDGGTSDGTMGVVAEVSPAASLPFDPKDASATFTAHLIVSDVAGGHPAATLAYGGKTYTADANGVITVPGVKVQNAAGLRVTASGFMPKSVLLQYASAGTGSLRVVLERAGTVASFDAAKGGSLTDGPVAITFPPAGIVDANGKPYTGNVTVAALGIDAVATMFTMSMMGTVSIRDDFDPARIPQGYGLAVDAKGNATTILPEATFQAELTDQGGQPLNLAQNQTAGIVMKLSPATRHKLGDVVPVYSFAEANQRWAPDTTCTVQMRKGGGGLDCVGAVKHFSTYAVSSENSASLPKCARLKFDFVYSATYPPSLTAGGKTYTTPAALTVRPFSKALGTEFVPDAVSVDGTSFLSSVKAGSARVRFVAYRLEGGKVVADTLRVSIAKGEQPYDGDLPLSPGTQVTAAAVDASQAVSDNPFNCPANYYPIDLASATVETKGVDAATVDPKQPLADVSKCAMVKCAADQRCIEGTGKCATVASCTDKTKNGTESDVDCGGSCMTKCANGKTCVANTDCASGTCNGGTCGDPCWSASFDGKPNTLVSAPHNASYDPAGPFTIEAWVRPTSLPGTQSLMVIAGHVDANTNQSYTLLLDANLYPGFGLSDGTMNQQPFPFDMNALPLNTWTHLAGVFDQKNAYLYRNGMLVDMAPAMFMSVVKVTQPFSIGNDGPKDSDFGLIGQVDEVRLSKVARYIGTFTPAKRFTSDADTLALFHLDPPMPGSKAAPDSSPLKNDGMLVGGASYAPMCP